MKVRSALILSMTVFLTSSALAENTTMPVGFEGWGFLLGDWDLMEQRYGFDGEPIQTNAGESTFSLTLRDQRIQEIQALAHGDESIDVLHVFVFDPRSQEVEITRTDSGHYGFWTIIGTIADDEMRLREKHPRPDSDVTRRITYRRIDADHFERELEFSTDDGESWFVRSRWSYSRRSE